MMNNMETEHQKQFRELLAPEMSNEELIDRVVEYIGITDNFKEKLEKRKEEIKDYKSLLIMFLEDLRDYMRESHNNLAFDDRTSEELVTIFMNEHPNLYISNHLNWDKVIDGISNYLEIEYKRLYGIPKEEFFHFIVSYMESEHPEIFEKKKINWDQMWLRFNKDNFPVTLTDVKIFEWFKNQPELIDYDYIEEDMDGVIDLLRTVISWEKDLSEYMSLEGKLREKYIIKKRNQ